MLLSNIMAYGANVKYFFLSDYHIQRLPDKYQAEWTNNLQKNQLLCHSIEKFSLNNTHTSIRNCIETFQTIKSFVDLKELELWLSRSLTKPELDALNQSFTNGLKRLNKIDLNLNLEMVNGEELFLYLSKLPSIVRLN